MERGGTKIELDDATAALSELEADDLMVQARAPAGASSSTTSGFAARSLLQLTPSGKTAGIWLPIAMALLVLAAGILPAGS